MTEPIEPCRAMIDGRPCGEIPAVFDDRTCECPKCGVPGWIVGPLISEWNTLQRDRLDAARWRELLALRKRCAVTRTELVLDVHTFQNIDRAIGAEAKENDNEQ